MYTDTTIFDLIQLEQTRQQEGLELIASENYVSNEVLQALGSILTNKYAEGLPYKRYYGGCEIVDEIEQLTINRVKQLFGAEWANVQPHSGAQANAAVMLACLQTGDAILGFQLAHGGHLTHGSSVSFSGKLYKPHFYGVHPDTNLVNYEELEAQAIAIKPKLIICGASSYSRDWDYARIRKVADEIGAMVLADIAHPAGLIAKGMLNNPLDHCHIVTSTTHKTLRGPRGGIILMGKDFANTLGYVTSKGEPKKMSTLLDSAVFPGIQGGPLEHCIAAKGVAFGEALTPAFGTYMQQVKNNAQELSRKLMERGYNVLTGGTDNHCILIDVSSKNVTGKQAEFILGKAGITVNKNMIPYDKLPATVTSGIRIGTPAITTRGLKETDMEWLANVLDKALLHADNESILLETKKEIATIMRPYPTVAIL